MSQAVQDQTPQHSQGFGAAESADETRQAQQQLTNDTPADVNFNAIMARSQGLTVDIAGKNYEAASDRRTIIADALLMPK